MALSTIKEFREFFLRNIPVSGGSKPDQEANYPTQYQATDAFGNIRTAYNRFLKSNIPSQDVLSKLFNSIGFKLNPEDTATTSAQGFVKVATDANAKAGINTTPIISAVQASQLPTIESIAESDNTQSDFTPDFPLPTGTHAAFIRSAALNSNLTRNEYQLNLSSGGFWSYFVSVWNYLRAYSSDGLDNREVNITNNSNPINVVNTIPAYYFKKVGDFIRIRQYISWTIIKLVSLIML